MRVFSIPWEAKAAAKRANTLSKIRSEWRLSAGDLERAANQRDLTGSFINQFLDEEDIDIVSMNSLAIISDLKKGKLTTVQVTTAFCKVAAIAHQIVST